jgi:hypothetical protein
MTADAAAGSQETLRDGRVVTVRPLCAADAAGVEGLWRRLDLDELVDRLGAARVTIVDRLVRATVRAWQPGLILEIFAADSLTGDQSTQIARP